MMKFLRHIALILTVLFLAISCGGKRGDVIPRGKLAEIYAEMLMVDQWIIFEPSCRKVADTSLVYEPIFEKYGYTSNDYRRSVDVYLDDPERFSRILRKTGVILEARLKDAERRNEELRAAKEQERMRDARKITVEIDMDTYFPYLADEPYVHYYDSLAVECDSLQIYRFKNIDRGDTIYRDLRMVILDSLSVKDSLMTSDTLVTSDTISE